MKQVALVSLIFLTLSGCIQTVEMKTDVDRSAMAFINKPGTARIDGQAFMRQNGGGVVTAAGERVLLVAATPYTDEFFGIIKAGQYPANISEMAGLGKIQVADATGNFSFENLSGGEYYVSTRVKWLVGSSVEGGVLVERVSLKQGEKRKLIMSR